MSLGVPDSAGHSTDGGTGAPSREAIGAFRRAALGEPGDPDYFYILGCGLARQGRHADAVAALREALATPGSHPSYRRALGESLFRLSSFEEAAEAFAQVLREDQGDAEAANGLGVALLKLGRAKEAAESLRSAVRADASRADWLSNLGAALMAGGDSGESLRLLRRAVALSPQSPLARRNLGRALLAGKAHADALDSFREVLRLCGDDAVGQLDLGDALFASGRHEEAEAAYERGVAREPALAASRDGSRAAWQIIRLDRARRELDDEAPKRKAAGATVWAGILAAAHAVKPWLASLGRTPARRISTVIVLILLVLVGRGALVLLPHYIAHHRLHDDIVRLAREPNYDDGRVREEVLRAVHTYSRDPYVRADDVQVQRFSLVRHVTFGYEVPMALLPGLITSIPFRMEVEEPCLVEPPPVVL